MSLEERRFQVRGIAESGKSVVEIGVIAKQPRRLRLAVHNGGPHVLRVGQLDELRRCRKEDRRDRGVQRPARPARDGLCCRLDAAHRVEHHRREPDGRKARRLSTSPPR